MNKPASAEKKNRLAEFNKMYRETISKQKEIVKKLKQLQQEAREVDALAERAFWYAIDYLYDEPDRRPKCVNKRTFDRVDYLDDLRFFSHDI